MVINVECIDRMIDDICDYLDIVPEYLQERILDIWDASIEDKFFDSNKFYKLSASFVSEYSDEKIEEVCLCHLTRCIGQPSVLLPLCKLLTTDNLFSNFLKERNVEFYSKNKNIVMVYKGKPIPPIELYDPDSVDNKHTRLAGRLGWCGEKDYCVNGFLFGIDLKNSTDSYYHTLMDGPELLQDIDSFLNTNLCQEYKKCSKYYLAIAKVPLNKIIYDDGLNNGRDRTKQYLAHCFQFLLSWYTGDFQWSKNLYNVMIRMNDFEFVNVDHYLEL